MKISDAYFDGGFGQRQVRPQGVVMPDTSGAMSVARAGQQLGGAVVGVALQEMEMQGRADLLQANERKNAAEQVMREQDAELKRMEKLRRTSAAKTRYLAFEGGLASVQQAIVDDPEIKPADYQTEFRKRAAELATPLREELDEEQWLTFGPDVDNRINRGSEEIFKAAHKEIQDAVWADDLRAADALLNDPTKSARQKVQILRDPNFFADSGRTEPEIEKERQRLVDTAIESEVITEFAKIKGDASGLRKFSEALSAKTADGQYSYMPEMNMKDRSRYIDHADSAIRAAETERKRQEAEAKRQRTDNARTAFDLYKSAKEDGQPLSLSEENNLLRQMQGTSYYEGAKRIQKNTSSFGYVMEKVKKDPLAAGAAQLGLTIPPLDPRNTAAWPQQLQQRGQVAGAIKQKYGLSFLPILTNQEATGLVEFMGVQSPRGLVQTVQGMASIPGMKGDSMNRISQQVAAADPGLGIVIGLAANGRANAAFHVAAGNQIIKAKAATDLKGKNGISLELDAQFEKKLQGALATTPMMREDMKAATRAAYISMAADKGITDGSFDESLYNKAFSMVVGDTAKVGGFFGRGGKAVILPSGMNEAQFKDSFKGISAETVKDAGGFIGYSDPEKAASKIKSNGKLYEAGNGKYKISVDGTYLRTSDGRDYLWDPFVQPTPSKKAEHKPAVVSTASHSQVKPQVKQGKNFFEEMADKRAAMKKEGQQQRIVANKEKYQGLSSDEWVTAENSSGQSFRTKKHNTYIDDNGIIRMK